MSDIVERLRDHAQGGGRYVQLGLFSEAADEIERLRADSGDGPYYKALYEEAEAENAKLRAELAQRRESVAHLWQHVETGRTRVVMPDQIADHDASWQLVGPLFLGAPLQRKPLSEETLLKLWGSRSDGPDNHEIVSFARAIERAHGIGGDE